MIVSCSRRTDIPAFYSRWFFNRVREGFVCVRNPMNAKQIRRISLAPEEVDCFVFWTKNPAPMLDELRLLQNYSYYFQFTLTPYGRDLEPNLPPMDERINSFLRLADRIGPQRVIWRYDPILFSKDITINYHRECFERIANRLSGHTRKCMISFIDMYRHIHHRMAGLAVRAPEKPEMRRLAGSIAQIAQNAGMKVETCAEEIDLADLGIDHGSCIDARLISEITGRRLPFEKDKYQRKLCGCVAGVDIGQYDTCPCFCQYCYANVSRNKIEKNCALHDEQSPLLIGEIDDR